MYNIPIYSKTPKYTGFPEYYDKAKGMNIWIDGKKYIDICHHLGTNLLGYSNSYVNHYVKKCINKGNSSLLNHRYMEKFANFMLSVHPWADSIRFGNSGGEMCYLALELAKEKIVNIYKSQTSIDIHYYGYNGWIIKNNNKQKIEYNKYWNNIKLNNINEIINRISRPDILVFELIRHEYPKPKTIKLLKEWQKQGTILILDEITSGFKFNFGGAHLLYDLIPDLCVFSKSIGNGYSISCIIGKDEYMESDLWISSTNLSDGIGFVAGYHTIKMLKHCNYKKLVKLGQSVLKIWSKCSKLNNIEIELGEVPQIANFKFKRKHQECKSIYIKEMLKQGILASDQFYPSFCHTANQIGKFAKACNIAFGEVKRYLDNPKKYGKINIIEVLNK